MALNLLTCLFLISFISGYSDEEYNRILEASSSARTSTPLLEAIVDENLIKVEKLLSTGADPNFMGQFEVLPVTVASSIEILRLLEKYGVNFNKVNSVGELPVFYSYQSNLLNFLATRTKNLSHQDKYGRTVLHHYLRGGQDKIYYPLITKDNVNLRDLKGRCILYGYVSLSTQEKLTFLKFILEKGYKRSNYSIKGFLKFSDKEVLSYMMSKKLYLLENGSLDIEFLRLANQLGIVTNHLIPKESLELLNNKKSSLNEKLLNACLLGDIQEVEFCLKNGADPNYEDSSGDFPLLFVNDLPKAKLLISYGAKTAKINSLGENCLWSYTARTKELLDFLIKKGAQLDLINLKGENLLFRVISNGDINLLHQALKFCDISLLNKQGDSPFTYFITMTTFEESPLASSASINQIDKVLSIFIEHGFKFKQTSDLMNVTRAVEVLPKDKIYPLLKQLITQKAFIIDNKIDSSFLVYIRKNFPSLLKEIFPLKLE